MPGSTRPPDGVLPGAGFTSSQAQRIYETTGTTLLGWLACEDACRALRADPTPAHDAIDSTVQHADEVAQSIAFEARVVYIDKDPITPPGVAPIDEWLRDGPAPPAADDLTRSRYRSPGNGHGRGGLGPGDAAEETEAVESAQDRRALVAGDADR